MLWGFKEKRSTALRSPLKTFLDSTTRIPSTFKNWNLLRSVTFRNNETTRQRWIRGHKRKSNSSFLSLARARNAYPGMVKIISRRVSYARKQKTSSRNHDLQFYGKKGFELQIFTTNDLKSVTVSCNIPLNLRIPTWTENEKVYSIFMQERRKTEIGTCTCIKLTSNTDKQIFMTPKFIGNKYSTNGYRWTIFLAAKINFSEKAQADFDCSVVTYHE